MPVKEIIIDLISDDEAPSSSSMPSKSLKHAAKPLSVEEQLAERRKLHEKRHRESKDADEAPPAKKRAISPRQTTEPAGIAIGSLRQGKVYRSQVDAAPARNGTSYPKLFPRTGLCKVGIYSYFVADGEFYPMLPLRTSIPLYIVRDPSLGGFVQFATRLAKGKNIFRTLSDDDWETTSQLRNAGNDLVYSPNLHVSWSKAQRGSGAVHSKVHGAIYDGFYRFVGTSANAMATDMIDGDSHYFIQDFPRRTKPLGRVEGDFERRLIEHLRLLDMPDAFLDDVIGHFDFTGAKADIIVSRPGVFTNSAALRDDISLLRLQALARTVIKKGDEVHVEVNSASVGGCTEEWLDEVKEVFTGGNGTTKSFQLVFPTKEDTLSGTGKLDIFSRLGNNNAMQVAGAALGTRIKKDEREGKKVDRSEFFRYLPKVNGQAFHTKFIAVYVNVDPREDAHAWPAYVVLGSHNFSSAAWGKLGYDNNGRPFKVTGVNNCELSVFIRGDDLKAMMDPGSSGDDLFAYQRPAPSWRQKDMPFNGYGVTG